MKKYFTAIYSTMLLALTGCEKINYYPDDPVTFEQSIVLSHHGEKDSEHGENTYEACIKALEDYDGLEVDVQMSKDNTIWLSHSSEVQYCDGSTTCFVETSDAAIEDVSTCNGADISYTKLEDVLKYMDENNIRKPLSIDMKGWFPCNASSLNIESEERFEAEQVISLAEEYHMADYLLFENELTSVLNWAKGKNNHVQTFLYSYGNFEQDMLIALDNGIDGLSYKSNFGDTLNADRMYLLHKKGLKVVAWNIPDSSYQSFLESIQVDYLEVDND